MLDKIYGFQFYKYNNKSGMELCSRKSQSISINLCSIGIKLQTTLSLNMAFELNVSSDVIANFLCQRPFATVCRGWHLSNTVSVWKVFEKCNVNLLRLEKTSNCIVPNARYHQDLLNEFHFIVYNNLR